MAVLIVIIIFVLIGAVVLLVGAPLRAPRDDRRGDGRGSMPAPAAAGEARVAELRVARETKYREIRDAEMDFRTGKLSEEDYRAIDAELRGEALRILDSLRELGEEPAEEPAEEPGGELPARDS